MPPPSQPSHLPYSVSLSPDEARASATSGASLLLLDVPPGTIVGIDHRSFIAGPNFKGVKMIPTVSENGGGAHFVATNATGAAKKKAAAGNSVGPTNFFFFHASVPGSVTVRRWSPEHEVLVPLEDEDEAERYAAGVRSFDFDANLAPYDLGSWGLWQSLTRFISPRTTARIAPAMSSKMVAMSVVAEAEEVEKREKRGGGKGRVLPPTEAERKLDEQLERGRKSAAGGGSSTAPLPAAADDAAVNVVPDVVGAPRYVELPRYAVVARGGGSSGSIVVGVGGEKQAEKGVAPATLLSSSPSLLTAANLDKTSTLQAVVRSPPFGGDARELLGEFQHAFVSFWAGHSLLGFGAWRECVRLVLGCEAGVCLSSERVGGGEGGDDGGGGGTRGEGETATATAMKVDGGFFREFVDALSAQLAVATTTTTTTTTKSGSSASSAPSSSSSPAAASTNSNSSIVDDLLEDSFLKKVARRFLENVREASEEGGVDYYLEDDDGGKGSKTKKIRLPPPLPELQESCARLSRVLEEGLGWAGLGKPRMKELRLGGSGKRGGGGGGGGVGGGGFGGGDSDSDDSDGPVVVLDVEKGY